MKLRISILCVGSVMLAGCVTPPAKHDFSNSKSISASYDATWNALIAWFASRNIPIKTVAKDSGVIYAERESFDNTTTRYADCGVAPLAADTGFGETFNVYVKRGETEQNVSINTSFWVRRTTAFSQGRVDRIDCQSTGTFEREFLNSIKVE